MHHVIAIALLILCIAACAKTMPSNWPEPSLTLPPGSTIIRSRRFDAPASPVIPHAIVHIVYFDNQISYANVITHAETCLKQQGYLKSIISAGSDDTATYVSANGVKVVRVADNSASKKLGGTYAHMGDYDISIAVHDTPNQAALEFAEKL